MQNIINLEKATNRPMLCLGFTELRYPYDDGDSDQVIWGVISIYLYNENNGVKKDILNWQWDLKILIEWFVKNKEHILNEKFPLTSREGKSIAQMLFEFYESNEPDNVPDKILDDLYYYRETHCLRFALEGTDIPAIFIGKNGDLEISFFSLSDNWNYFINIEQFYKTIDSLIVKYF